MWAEAELGIGTEEFTEEEFEGAFEVGDADAFSDVEAFHLVELGEVGGVDFIAPVGGPWGDDADGGCGFFHGADLDRARVGTKEASVGEIEGIFFVASGVIGGGIEGIEAMPFGFDVGAIGESEAHSAEDLDGPVLELGDGVERTLGGGGAWERGIDAGESEGIGMGGEFEFALVEGGGDGVTGIVEEFTDARFVVFSERLHAFAEEGDRA